MQKITPFLWFDEQAEEAARYYTSIFKDSRITKITYYPEPAAKASGRSPGSVMTVEFELNGQQFVALNGGPHFKFTEAVSFSVGCKTQAEIDRLWKKLSAGGKAGPCGWLKDKFGLSWQIVPEDIEKWLSDKDPERPRRVMEEVLQMDKLDIKRLQKAYKGKAAKSK